jgi:hypothetical protein
VPRREITVKLTELPEVKAKVEELLERSEIAEAKVARLLADIAARRDKWTSDVVVPPAGSDWSIGYTDGLCDAASDLDALLLDFGDSA